MNVWWYCRRHLRSNAVKSPSLSDPFPSEIRNVSRAFLRSQPISSLVGSFFKYFLLSIIPYLLGSSGVERFFLKKIVIILFRNNPSGMNKGHVALNLCEQDYSFINRGGKEYSLDQNKSFVMSGFVAPNRPLTNLNLLSFSPLAASNSRPRV